MLLINALLTASGCVVASIALYLALLAIAARFHRESEITAEPLATLAVLIPAHDEAGLIGHCVESLIDQSYPRDRYSVVVIADNCSDDTAGIARGAGADLVLVRDAPDARGKGAALRWALDRLLTADGPPDAIAVVDADSYVAPDFLEQLALPLHAGAQAIQGNYLLEPNRSRGAALRATAFLLVNGVRPAGRAALGMSTFLVGNGMLFAGELLRRHPWNAFTSTEDLEYSLELQTAGVRIEFAAQAVVRSETAPNPRAAAVQQLRWEGGKTYLLRSRVPRLLRDAARLRRPGLIVTAFDLATPPLGLVAGAAIAGSVVAAGLAVSSGSAFVFVPWLVADAAIVSYVVVGLYAVRAPRWAYRALLGAPVLLLTKPLTLARVLRFRSDSWVRTERASDQAKQQA
jgi:cellulose synthase/poly-beta-1,6-N-acetylglucosamine synthase-like glycosyltransferase